MTQSLTRGPVVGVLLVLSCGGAASSPGGSGGSSAAGESKVVKCESDADCARVTGASSCQMGSCRAPELAQAGAPSPGGAGNVAGAGPIAGGDGRTETGGMPTGSGGISAGTSGGGSGGAGAGGTSGLGGAAMGGAGTAGGGTGGTGMGGANQIVNALDGLRLDSPCGVKLGGNTCLYPDRPSDDGLPFSAMAEATMSGTPGTAYQVTLRIRGVTGMTRVMGGVHGSPENFVIGGTRYPDNTSEPGASLEQWRITTSSPREHYYLNAFESLGQTNQCALIDMVETITIDGGATVTLDVYDGNSHQASNTGVNPPLAPPGVPGSMNSGQFIQINVEGVAK